jgi:hypothetical protein
MRRAPRHTVDIALVAAGLLLAIGAAKDVVDGVHHTRRVAIDRRAYLRYLDRSGEALMAVGRPRVRFGSAGDVVCDRTRLRSDRDDRDMFCATVARGTPHKVARTRSTRVEGIDAVPD